MRDPRSDVPDTPEELITGWDDSDAQAGRTAALLLPTEALEAMTVALLDELDGDWDQPATVYGITTSDVALRQSGVGGREQLRKLAGRYDLDLDDSALEELASMLEAGVAVTDHGAAASFSLVQYAEVGGHPYDWLCGRELPWIFGAAVFIQEGWMTLSHAGSELDGARRDERGRVEIRIAFAVSRTGAEVQALQVRNGPRTVHVFTPEEALVPGDESDPLPRAPGGSSAPPTLLGDVTHIRGRMVDAGRRALGLPTRPPTRYPWRAVLDMWAPLVARVADDLGSVSDEEAAGLLSVRPDWLWASSQMLSTWVADNAEGHPGFDAALLGEATDAEVHDLIDGLGEMPDFTAAALIIDAGREGRAAADVLASLEPLIWERVSAAGWDAVRMWLRHVASQPDVSMSPDEMLWLGPQAALSQLTAEVAVRGAADRLVYDQRLPKWFRKSVKRAVVAASRTAVSAPQVPFFDPGGSAD